MKIVLNFNLEAWIKHLELDASSEEDAIKKLMGMTLSDIMKEGAVVDSNMKITELETTVYEYDVVVKVSNIVYDLDPDTMDVNVIEYLKGFLPNEMTLTLTGVTDSDDIDTLISDEIFGETSYDVDTFSSQIIEKK
jgi:hypothetical protein